MGTTEIPRRDVLNTLETSFGEHKQFGLLVPCLENVVGSLAAAADPQLVVQILQAACAKAKDFAPLRLALSRAHNLARNHENAFKELSNALRLDPALTKARVALSWHFTRVGDDEKALAAAEEATHTGRDVPLAWLAYGVLLSKAGRQGEAVKVLEKACALEPTWAKPFYSLGIAHSKAGRLYEAIRYCETAALLDPYSSDAWAPLGISYDRAGQSEQAIVALEKAFRLDGGALTSTINLAIAYRSAGQKGQAKKVLADAVGRFAASPVGLSKVSAAFGTFGHHQEAARVARHALTLQPDLEEAFRSLLINLPLTSDPKNRAEAIEIGNALTSKTNDPSDWTLLSRALSRGGQLEEAIKAARHALTLQPDLEEAFRSLLINLPLTADPKNRTEAIEIGNALTSKTNDPSDWALLSAAYGQNDQHMQSVESAIAALKLDPKCTQAYQSLAMSLGKAKGREAELLRAFVLTNVGISEDALREAVASEPKDSNMWRLLTWNFTDKGQCSTAALIASNMLENDSQLHGVIFSVVEELRDPCPVEALHLLARLIAIDGTRCKYWNLRGVLNRDLRILDVACLDHEKALSLDPNYPDAWYALGRTYETMGKRGDACAAYSRALVLKPNYTKALRRKQALGC